MDLLLLPGNSKKNQPWIESIASGLKPIFDAVHVQAYNHWQQGGSMKTALERKLLISTMNTKGEYGVFAKSAGVALVLEAIGHGAPPPKAAVFCGTTSRSAKMLIDWHVPTLFIQETKDPFLHFPDLMEVVAGLRNDRLWVTEIAGSKHAYEQVEDIVELAEMFFNKYSERNVK